MKPSLLTQLADRMIVPGAVGFTSLGYRMAAKSFAPLDQDLSGRTMVVTGATSGLGKSAAKSLARMGASVVLVGRSPDKTNGVRGEIKDSTGNDDLSVAIADLSLMRDVRRLAQELLDRHEQIHVLANVAGALFNERTETEEGNELTLATNLMSQFLLTNLLMDRLRSSTPARIIAVSSGGMYTQGISTRNLQFDHGEYDGPKAYARTKRGQVILTQLWSEMLAGTGVVANAMHPGWADTAGVQGSLPGFYRYMKPILRTAEQGADTIVWLAAAPEAAGVGGLFFLDRKPHPTAVLPGTAASRAEKLALWARLAALTGWDGPGPSPGAGE